MNRVEAITKLQAHADAIKALGATSLYLFGSAVRDEARPDSDIDLLVSFEPDAAWSLYDMVDMQEELRALFGRNVDFVMKEGIRNPFRRHEILSTRRVVYAA